MEADEERTGTGTGTGGERRRGEERRGEERRGRCVPERESLYTPVASCTKCSVNSSQLMSPAHNTTDG
jgi:hypothetical protein